MQTREDLENHFDTMVDRVERLGDEVIEIYDLQEVGDEEEDIYLKQATFEEGVYNCKYDIIARSDFEMDMVRYGYDLLGALQNYLESEEGEEFFELDDLSKSDSREAARTIINRVRDEDMRRLKFQLQRQISNPLTELDVLQLDDGGISGFIVMRHIFPHEEKFVLSDLYDAITAVISTGEMGSRYLNNSFAIEIPEESETEEDDYLLDFEME